MAILEKDRLIGFAVHLTPNRLTNALFYRRQHFDELILNPDLYKAEDDLVVGFVNGIRVLTIHGDGIGKDPILKAYGISWNQASTSEVFDYEAYYSSKENKFIKLKKALRKLFS